MSLITQCPACSTMFRVVPDQLRVSDGWVRCGECDEVFDANAHLRPPEAAAPTPMQMFRIEAEVELPESAQEAQPQRPAAAPEPEFVPVPAPEPEPEPPKPEHDSLLQVRPSRGHASGDKPPAFTLNMSALGDLVDNAPPVAEPLRYVQADVPVPPVPAHTSVADLSFMRNRQKPTFWERPAARRLLGFGSALAALALLLQLVVQERERIVAMEPALQPVLAALCSGLGCKLNGLHQIEVLVIDSSGFAKVRSDVYRLSFNLRNSGPLPVTTPALELTLTDAQEQPVVRRVLAASDFAASQTTLAAGAELNAVVPVAVQIAGGAKFAGYRLLAFYP